MTRRLSLRAAPPAAGCAASNAVDGVGLSGRAIRAGVSHSSPGGAWESQRWRRGLTACVGAINRPGDGRVASGRASAARAGPGGKC